VKAGLDRDRQLDKALKQALEVPTDVPPSEACLDAETLAAWMDDGLHPAAVALAEAHASSCARCQALVGVMIRSAPEVPVSGHAPTAFWRWWLAPVAAAVAATVVWMVVPDQQGAAPLNPPAEEVAQAPSTGDVAEPLPPASLSAPPPPAVVPGRPAETHPRQEKAADASAVSESSKRIGETRSTESGRSRQPSAELDRPAAAPQMSATFRAVAPRVIASPDPAIRWRVEANGAVDYTTDAERTWERVSTEVSTEIVAGSSPSPAVCWLVGRGGLVMITTNGRTFARVSAPVDEDLVDVQATSARTAVVTTADGRAFRTDDGGLSWRPRE
jgi:hypothetical protein